MKYNFDIIPDREKTSCVKFDKRDEVFHTFDVIPMWIADMDFEIAPEIANAIDKRAAHRIYGYEFRNESVINNIISWVGRRNNWQIEPEWLSFTPGVVAGLVFGIHAFSEPGDGILIQPPVYPPFADSIHKNGRKLINNPMIMGANGYEIDFDDLDKKLAEAKLLIFCNPHNPTGRVFTREELLRVGELCVKHDVYIISDEIHSDLVYKPNTHIHIASLSPQIAERTVTLMAPSKTFNIAGLSTSVAIVSGERTREKFFGALNSAHIVGGNTFGNTAMSAAYEFGEPWLLELLNYLESNIDYTADFIEKNMPKIKVYKPESTFLMWLDFTELGMNCEQLSEFMVKQARLGLNEGREYGEEGCSCMRLNIGTSRAVLGKALKQLLTAYNRLEQE